MTEQCPDTTNVVYMDEYPEAKKRVWLRRLAQDRLRKVVPLPQIIHLPDMTPPDEPA